MHSGGPDVCIVDAKFVECKQSRVIIVVLLSVLYVSKDVSRNVAYSQNRILVWPTSF